MRYQGKNGSLTLDGDFTLMGDYYGVMAGYDVNIKGNLSALAYDKGSFPSIGIYTTSGSIRFTSALKYTKASGKLYAVSAGVSASLDDSLYIKVPENGKILNGTIHYSDNSGIAAQAEIEPKSERIYKIYGLVNRMCDDTYFDGNVEITLEQNGEWVDGAYLYSKDKSYTFNLKEGTYQMTVHSFNHVDRVYPLVVSGNMTMNVTICPLGDVNLSMGVNIKDVNALYKHVKEDEKIINTYMLACSDVAGTDLKVDIKDVNRLYKHVKGTICIWTEMV